MAKVSIILPIYNVEIYLRECLESVVNQTLKEIEIICVNDGSTDASLDIIQEYAAADSRIVVISGENGGYGKAMNQGLMRASGEFIGIVEPDDYVSLTMFEELYDLAVSHNLDFIKADFYRFTQEGDGRKNLSYEYLDPEKKGYGRVFNPSEDPRTIRFTLNTWSGIYKREFIETYHIRHNETPGASFQDNGFFFQTFIYGKRAMIINKPYYMNRRDNPNSSVKSKEKVYCMNMEYDFIQDILKQDPQIWERFKYMYWWKKYHNYMFTLGRIAEQYKKEYLKRMGMEFKRALQLNEIKQEDFLPEEWNQIMLMIGDSQKYYRQYIDIPKWQLPIRRMIPKPIKRVLKKILWRN